MEASDLSGATLPGYEWRCHCCTFRTVSIREAREHLVETEERYRAGNLNVQHLLSERNGTKKNRKMYTTPIEGEVRIGLWPSGKKRRS